MLSLGKNLQPVDFGFRDKTRPMKDYLRFLNRSTVLRNQDFKMQTKTSCRDLCPGAKSQCVITPGNYLLPKGLALSLHPLPNKASHKIQLYGKA